MVNKNTTVTLDLNGYVLKRSTESPGACRDVIRIAGKLTLKDSNPTAVHKYTKGDDGLYTWDEFNGTIEVAGGAITGACNSGVYIPGGSFTMEGGSIVGNSAGEGGGVDNHGTFTMNGGSIVGNTASDYGGGVYNAYVNTFTMNGGSIKDNTAKDEGGGVYNHECPFTMNGGSIEGNTADCGGGVYNLFCATFTMKGGSIVGNTATRGGGVFNGNCDTFNMNGGSIVGNTADYGGGVALYDGGTFGMKGGSIVDNTATRGGGVLVGRILLNDGKTYFSDHPPMFKIVGGGIADEIDIDGDANCPINILGGYFGTKAKKSIRSSWLGIHSWANNDGSKAYPKDTYPYRVK